MATTKSRPRSVRPSGLWAGMAIGIALALGAVSIGAAAGLVLPFPHAVVTEAGQAPQAAAATAGGTGHIRDEAAVLKAAQKRTRSAAVVVTLGGTDQISDEVAALKASRNQARQAAMTATVAGDDPVGSGRYR